MKKLYNSLDPNVIFDKTNGQNGGGIVDKNPNLFLNLLKGKK